MKAIIWDVYKGIRRLDPNESYPISLEQLTDDEHVMDWHLSIYKKCNINNFTYVGGYHIEKMINIYPNIKFYFKNNSELDVLDKLLKDIDDNFIINESNILCKSRIINNLLNSNSDISIGVSNYCIDNRFENHIFLLNGEKFYYSGLIYIKEKVKNDLRELIKAFSYNNNGNSLISFMDFIKDQDINLQLIPVNNEVINVTNKKELSKFMLGTKAQTLENLMGLVKKSKILDQISFSVEQWYNNKKDIYLDILSKYKDKNIVIRSSSQNEDSWIISNAGKFESYLNISANNYELVEKSINNVIKSYDSNNPKDQVLIQEFVRDSIISGVVFTRDLETAAPYYIVNYDDCSLKTDTVTGGKDIKLKTEVILKDSDSEISNPVINKIINAVKEIENIIDYDGLDIEFIITDEHLFVVQVRPIAAFSKKSKLSDIDVLNEVKFLSENLQETFKREPLLYGETNILGNMPDWNPAELIGSCPRPLAASLYQKIITNSAWALARDEIGYKFIENAPLVTLLCGRPYVDVRKSLNSFLPCDLSSNVSEKIINFQINKLRNNLEFHDKIEFKIASTCLDFSFQNYKKELANQLSKSEISEFESKLFKLTNEIVVNSEESIDKNYRKISILNEKRKEISNYSSNSIRSIVVKLNYLVNDCINYGTIPFSVLARYAFIAMSFLKSLLSEGVFSESEYDSFLKSIDTVASDLKVDMTRLFNNNITKKEFINKYGHLRPSTYDIISLNYKEAFNIYFSKIASDSLEDNFYDDNISEQDLFDEKSNEIEILLKKSGYGFTSQELKEFICKSIIGREYAKFQFTKNIDNILELVIQLGDRLSISREDMSYIHIDKILKILQESPSHSIRQEFVRECEYRKKKHILSQTIKIPNIILSEKDIFSFQLLEWQPNYITNKKVIGNILEISKDRQINNIENKIILIKSADPGYDWIFGYDIKGLITEFGGAASHMSIRCAEFGIPAAIGCGDIIYNEVKHAKVLELNCENKYVKVIK